MSKLLSGVMLVIAGFSSESGAEASTPTHARAIDIAPMREALVPAQQQGICCCQMFAQRWQYSWMTPSSCSQSRGTCVSLDHCGS
jgi:hypothetical protein